MAKQLQCISCGTPVPNVANADVSVICWECTIESVQKLEPPRTSKKTTTQGYPKGWRFMKIFVHADGKVYYKGKEQVDLKGSLPPTEIIKKPKKTKQQRKEEKQAKLMEYNNIKKELKKETRKTYKKKLETKLKKLQKHI